MTKTKISWTQEVWNPIAGCTIKSSGPVWNGKVRFNEQWLTQPLKWKKPRHIFVCAHGDLFHENVKDEWIDQVFAIMALYQHHTFQVLTKRPERMKEYLSSFATCKRISYFLNRLRPDFHRNGNLFQAERIFPNKQPLPNVWLGVSVEDQKTADERIPVLLDTPAALRWISAEPLLGPINLRGDLDWVVVGGESGPNARPMNPDWARSLRNQCRTAHIPFFFKQMSKKSTIPDDLKIRKYPKERK